MSAIRQIINDIFYLLLLIIIYLIISLIILHYIVYCVYLYDAHLYGTDRFKRIINNL